MKFKCKINNLFADLRKQKCVAKQWFQCCCACAWWAFYDVYWKWLFVFTTQQQKESYKSGKLYIYGNYPENIAELIFKNGMLYTQIDKDSAIELIDKTE